MSPWRQMPWAARALAIRDGIRAGRTVAQIARALGVQIRTLRDFSERYGIALPAKRGVMPAASFTDPRRIAARAAAGARDARMAMAARAARREGP